jgi:hypothetical protein
MNRRTFLRVGLGLVASTRFGPPPAIAGGEGAPAFLTRGVVLVPEDLTLADWPERAKTAGLTTIGIHHQNAPQAVINWVRSDAGRRFLEARGKLGLNVEYELHAMKALLPRSLNEKNPEFFRMDERGRRIPDANFSAHSQTARDIAAGNAVAIAEALRPTTGRSFYRGGHADGRRAVPRGPGGA